MYHGFFIHSSVDGHLGCFHVLVIINSAVMNIGVHVSLSDLVSSVCMPRSGNTCQPMAVSFQCMTKSTTNKIIIIIIIIKERKKKTQHTLYLLYSDIQNSVAYLYINNELSESGIKKTIPFTIASQKR